MKPLLADKLADDPRIAQAKQLILDALQEHQTQLTSIQPAQPQRQPAYNHAVKQFGQMRGGQLYFPYLGSGFGKGPLVELADGSVKYDFITGIGVHGWGHGHPDLVDAAIDAALCDTIMQGNLQQSQHSANLIQILLDAAQRNGSNLSHCFLSTSGAMANENALKMLFQKKQPARRLLAFEGCFMGRTLALAQVTDKAAYRVGLPPTIAVDYVPFFNPQDPQGSTDRALHVLNKHLARYPDQHAAMCFELVQGEGGYYPGHRDFFIALMQCLKSHHIAVMVDEVQTFGRTTELFAFQHFGLDEYVDAVTIGKLSQVCATLFTDEFKPQPGLISQTFTGSTSSIFAAQKIIEGLLDGGYFGHDGKNNCLHQHFVARLQEIAQRQPGCLSGPFGIGAMVAFTPIDGRIETAKKLIAALYAAGVIAFIAGSNPARIRFLIPMGAVTPQDIDAVCEIIEQSLIVVTQELVTLWS